MNRKQPTQAAIARALGISKQMVSKAKRAGMPVTSIAAARAWRSRLDPARMKWTRVGGNSGLPYE